MSNGEFIDDLLDATMKRLYDTFGKPKDKPGAEENPPRNHYCGYCERWFATKEHWHDCD